MVVADVLMESLFTRQELWELESRALKASRSVVQGAWVRAYRDLAHAANVLDAFHARSEGQVHPAAPAAVEELRVPGATQAQNAQEAPQAAKDES